MRNRYVIYQEEEYMWINVLDLEHTVSLIDRLTFRKYLNNLRTVISYKMLK